MEADEVLDKAADLLEKHGHSKGRLQRSDGTMCAVGALQIARFNHAYLDYTEGKDAVFIKALEALRDQIVDATGPSPYAFVASVVTRWNDQPETTSHEVIDRLRWAAKDLRND